jgi:hypothetical protein
MAITVISGAFFCMAIYFLAKCIIKHEVILFLAGILTLTRAYISCFNDNLPENLAFYYGALFIVLLMYCMENKEIIFALFAGFYLSFCALSHPEIFMNNFPAYCLFFITLLISKNKKLMKDYRNLLIVMGIVLVMVLPYFLRIKGSQFSPQKIETNKMHETLAATLTGTLTYWNGYLVPILALGGILLIAVKRQTVNIYLWTYFLVVLGLIEFWRFFQICSFSWFELKPWAYSQFGTYYSYKTFLRYPESMHAAWYGGSIIWPVAIAVVIDFLYRRCRQYTSFEALGRYAIFTIVVATFLFVGFEFKKALQYPEYIKKSDYDALQWIRDNTPYENTLIYAPFDDTGKHPIYGTSFWVPIVSERKSILFRNYDLGGSFKFRNIDNPIKEKGNHLQQAAYSISNQESYKVFKDMGITHIFISACLSFNLHDMYQGSPFVERIHYSFNPNELYEGTALVYKVK